MDFKKTRKVISKLETLMDSFESIGEELSEIEISLLEKYIDDLKASLPRPKVVEEPTAVEATTVTEPPKVEIVEKPEPKKAVKKEVHIDTPIEETPKEEVKEEKNIEEESTPEPIQQSEDKEIESKKETNEPNISDDRLDQLFTMSEVEVKELSDRLKLKPIENIDKSLSINERILTQNDLFNGDADLMNATIATLNSLKSYDEAIVYLKKNIAAKLDWASDSKKGKALQFLQKIQRRYL